MNQDKKETAEDVIKEAVWHFDRPYKIFSNIAKYVPSTGIMMMGGLVTHSYIATGRTDLLVGGALLTLLGAGIIDISSGKNLLSRTFSKAASFISEKKKDISQSAVLAAVGLGACATLAGGETINFLNNYNGDIIQDLSSGALWDNLKNSASGAKIYANAAWFMAASALDIPAVNKTARKIRGMTTDNIIHMQNMLGVIGSMYILDFAAQAELSAFAAMASLQMLANAAGSTAHFFAQGSPASFLPLDSFSHEQKMALLDRYRNAVKDEQNAPSFMEAYKKEWTKMLVVRGHMTESEVIEMNKRSEAFASQFSPQP